jgi:hypothetical protein
LRVLNVGGGAGRDLPSLYKGWEQHLLDIDADVKPDICCDAKDVRTKIRAGIYDAVYCSHNLEHFYRHEVPVVLDGFAHVLKQNGFAHITVPDIGTLFEAVKGKDINDTYYVCNGGKITFHDVLYGWGLQVEAGNGFYAHKTGFTVKSLTKALTEAGFTKVMIASDGVGNIHSYAFKRRPSVELLRSLGI